MKHLKTLGLAAALAVAGLMTCAALAAGDNLTSPPGTTYTSSISASSSKIELNGAFTTITCKGGQLAGNIEKHGFGIDPGGKLSTLTFKECPITVNKAGSFDIDAEGAGSGDFQSFGAEITAETSVGTCVFTTSSTTLGSFTGNAFGNASIDWGPSKKIPITGGNFFCGSSGYLVGVFTITTPSKLTVDGL